MRVAIGLAAVAGLFATPALAASTSYKVNKDHTDVTFEVSHVGFSMKHGWFKDISGVLNLDPAKPEISSVDVTIKASSIDTNHAQRDKDLQAANFFDVAKFPDLHFVSTKVVRTGEDTADVQGNLTLHGVTKPLVLHAKLNKIGPNPFDQTPTAGFTATGALKRSDYGMGTFVPMIGDDVSIIIDAEFAASK